MKANLRNRNDRQARSEWIERAGLWALLGFSAIILFFGGASRADTFSQIVVRLASILVVAACAIGFERRRVAGSGRALVFALLCIGYVALQLVPLPPGLWAALPGHAMLAQSLRVADVEIGWRPLSLTPDLTVNSLLALLPPFAMLLAIRFTARPRTGILLPALLGGIAASALLGVIQIGSGTLYFYEVTNLGAPVGVFANRNHEAVFLALGFPLLACWVSMPHPDEGYRQIRSWIALCFAAALFPMLLITGSRAGLLLGCAAAIGALVLLWREGRLALRVRGRGATSLLKIFPFAVGLATVIAAIVLSRGEALERLLNESSTTGQRGDLLPLFVKMAGDFFPLGSGFGSFDSVFRVYEPFETLDPTYLNNAHNDLLQIAIEGGAIALVLVAVFIAWFGWRSVAAWRAPHRAPALTLARTASIMVAILLLASLVDYPLRTPLLACVLVIASAWLAGARFRESVAGGNATD